MDLGAAAEGVVQASFAGLFVKSFFCSLFCGTLALIGWIGRQRGFFIACLMALLAHAVFLVVSGIWHVAFSFDPDRFIVMFAPDIAGQHQTKFTACLSISSFTSM